MRSQPTTLKCAATPQLRVSQYAALALQAPGWTEGPAGMTSSAELHLRPIGLLGARRVVRCAEAGDERDDR